MARCVMLDPVWSVVRCGPRVGDGCTQQTAPPSWRQEARNSAQKAYRVSHMFKDVVSEDQVCDSAVAKGVQSDLAHCDSVCVLTGQRIGNERVDPFKPTKAELREVVKLEPTSAP